MAVEKYGDVLPEGVWANALSLTSPKDACRMSAVASMFRDASQSDGVWERFLPPDYREILSRAADASLIERFRSRKELYLHLCDHSVLIDGNRMSFSLEKTSGKKYFMISARELFIVWGDTEHYWRWKWNSVPESRFPEVAELLNVCWLEIRGKINLNMLSPCTNYAAYLVFTMTSSTYGFSHSPVEGWVTITNQEDSQKRLLCLDPEEPGVSRMSRYFSGRRFGPLFQGEANNTGRSESSSNVENPKKRDDGWMEVELGEHFVENGDVGDLEISLLEVQGGNWKSGLVVEGIEIRPKEKKL